MSVQAHRLYHLGCAKLMRSNLARMNENKSYSLYEAFFGKLLQQCQYLTPGNLAISFASKTSFTRWMPLRLIYACLFFRGLTFDLQKALSSCVSLNHSGYLPEFTVITDGKTSDIEVGRTLTFPTGSIVTIDKGYTDYAWFYQLTSSLDIQHPNTAINAERKYRHEA